MMDLNHAQFGGIALEAARHNIARSVNAHPDEVEVEHAEPSVNFGKPRFRGDPAQHYDMEAYIRHPAPDGSNDRVSGLYGVSTKGERPPMSFDMVGDNRESDRPVRRAKK